MVSYRGCNTVLTKANSERTIDFFDANKSCRAFTVSLSLSVIACKKCNCFSKVTSADHTLL